MHLFQAAVAQYNRDEESLLLFTRLLTCRCSLHFVRFERKKQQQLFFQYFGLKCLWSQLILMNINSCQQNVKAGQFLQSSLMENKITKTFAAWIYISTLRFPPQFLNPFRDFINRCVTWKQHLSPPVILPRGGQRSHSYTVQFQPDTHGHQSAAVKGKNKHFYCAAFLCLLSLASCSLKINVMAVMLIGQHLLVPDSLSIAPVPIGILLLLGHEWFVVSALLWSVLNWSCAHDPYLYNSRS